LHTDARVFVRAMARNVQIIEIVKRLLSFVRYTGRVLRAE
jgi:hypothetical protein